MKPIAVFYHCLFSLGGPPRALPAAFDVVQDQMEEMKNSGLLDATAEMIVGVNGGQESALACESLIPPKAKITLHGLRCKNECRTIRMIEEWLPGHEHWYVLYFHAKGATHPIGDDITGTWRKCMMRHTIANWQQCVKDLDAGCDAVGCHWMEPPATPEGQYIFAGTFWWAKASFLMTLPSIMQRERIKLSGIDSRESRYEAEVWLGNGPVRPQIKDYHGPEWNPSKTATCKT